MFTTNAEFAHIHMVEYCRPGHIRIYTDGRSSFCTHLCTFALITVKIYMCMNIDSKRIHRSTNFPILLTSESDKGIRVIGHHLDLDWLQS